MVLGVNYRLGLSPASGIPLTVRYLYKELSNTKNIQIKRFYPLPYIPSIIFDFFYCALLLLKHPVDILHGPSFILPVWKPKKTKYIVTIHDLAFIARPNVATWHFRLIYRFLTQHSLHIADRIVAVSESTRQDIIKFFRISPEKISVIPNGISQTYLNNLPQPAPYAFDYLLTVSTHPYRKNTFMLIDAFKKFLDLQATSSLVKEGTGGSSMLKLIIAGNLGDYGKQALLDRIAQLHLSDKIILTGKISELDLSALYQHAELFIYPSTYEGFGLPLLEAMASRCLVLGANTSCIPEVVPDPRCLFYPLTPEALANKILQLLSLAPIQKKSLITKNQGFASSFNWAASAKKYLKLLL